MEKRRNDEDLMDKQLINWQRRKVLKQKSIEVSFKGRILREALSKFKKQLCSKFEIVHGIIAFKLLQYNSLEPARGYTV